MTKAQAVSRKPRPYWHVDAKWVCGHIAMVVAAGTLLVGVLYSITAKGPATDLIAYTLAGMTSPEGIDSESGLEEARLRVAETGQYTVNFGGVPVEFTKQDVDTLSARELRLKVFRTYAIQFYDMGAERLAISSGATQEQVATFKKDSAIISVLGASTHGAVGKVLLGFIIALLPSLIGLVYFSHGMGRFVSSGVVLLFAGLPWVPLSIIASAAGGVSGTARSAGADGFEAVGAAVGYIAPLIVPNAAGIYGYAFFGGAILLLCGGVGATVRRFTRHT